MPWHGLAKRPHLLIDDLTAVSVTRSIGHAERLDEVEELCPARRTHEWRSRCREYVLWCSRRTWTHLIWATAQQILRYIILSSWLHPSCLHWQWTHRSGRQRIPGKCCWTRRADSYTSTLLQRQAWGAMQFYSERSYMSEVLCNYSAQQLNSLHQWSIFIIKWECKCALLNLSAFTCSNHIYHSTVYTCIRTLMLQVRIQGLSE
jgi:hypothetical protein